MNQRRISLWWRLAGHGATVVSLAVYWLPMPRRLRVAAALRLRPLFERLGDRFVETFHRELSRRDGEA